MIEYAYTFDLGEDYGQKFESLAEELCREDREEFLKELTFAAIDLAKALNRAENAALVIELIVKGFPRTEPEYKPDDRIPF